MDTKDYIKIFEQSSELLVVIDTNFAIVAASDAFLKATTTVRENIVGRNAFEVFPDNPDDKTANGESIVRASFNRVIKNKTKDVLPVVKYDIPKPESEGGGYEQKYWQATSSPILDENNNVKYIIHRTEDVTENKILITQLEFEQKALKLLEDSEKRYNMMLMQSPFPFALLKGENKVITFANDKLKATWGKGNNIEGKPLIDVLPELKDTPFPNLIDEVYKTGIPYYANEVLAPKHIKGQKEDVYYNFVYQPYLEVDETISGVTIIAAEVTAAVMVKKALEAQHEVEQKALKQIADSEKQLQNIFLNTPAAIAIFEGHEHKFILANQSYEKITNRKAKNLLGKRSCEVFPELIGTGTFELYDKVFETGESFTASEYAIMLDLKNEGVLRQCYFNFSIDPLKNDSGKIYGLIVVFYEITEQIEARKKIEDSEKRYNMMLMKSQFAFAVLKGKNMVITLANDSVKEMWGKGKDLEGKPLIEVLPEIKDTAFPGLLDKVYTTGIPFYGEELLAPVFRNGKLEDVYFNFVYQPYLEADETISGVAIIAYEVTASVTVKRALEAQHEAERKALVQVEETNKRYYDMLMKSSFAFSVLKGKDLVISLANDRVKKIWGKGEDVEGKPIFQLLPEIRGTEFQVMLDKVYNTGIPLNGNEVFARIERNGKLEEGYYNFVWQPYLEADKTISGVVCIAYDVTEMVLARKKIETSEARFKSIVMQTPVAIGIYKGKEYIAEIANEHCLQMLNKGVDFVGKPLFDVLPELETQGFKGLMDNVMESGTTYYGNELAFNIHKNNISTKGFYNFIIQQLRADDESVTGIIVVASEVTEQVLARQKVQESEERFRLLVMQAPVAIFVLLGEDLIIETMNQEMANFLDRKIEDSLHKPLFDVIAEVKDQVYKELLDTVLSSGNRFVSQELPLAINRNGRIEDVFVKFVYEPLREADGTVSGVMVLAEEITDQVNARKVVEESERNLRQVLDSMPQKITNADTEGNVIYFNQKWLDDTGLEFEKLKGWGWEKVIHPDDSERTKTKWTNSFKTGDIFDMECRILNKEGEYKWHLSRALPIKDENGKIKMWVGTNTEIHEQKEQKEVLEKVVKSRTRQLKQKNVELENANKDLTAFTYISSHDLQEPLRKIQSFVAIILEEEEQNLSDNGKDYFLRMQETAKRMQTLIEDLLAYSRASNSEKIFEKIELNILLDEVKKDFEEIIQQKKATIETLGSSEINIIRFQFRQLLHNLIGNSLKFSKENTAPHITITSKIEKGSTLNNAGLPARAGTDGNDKVGQEKFSPKTNYYHIIFTDNGIGFKPEYQERIFEVFQRLHSIKEYKGTGIGLAICKRIVENHKGIITATGELNKGARFDIYIPA